MEFSYIGYPATNYALDRTFNLAPPIDWVARKTNLMSRIGLLLFNDAPVPGTNNFWRIRAIPGYLWAFPPSPLARIERQ